VKKRNSENYHELPFNPALADRAKQLRQARNLSEVLLWQQIKRGQFKGLDFDRQKIIGDYIVDFYCAEKRVVIEIDGITHDEQKADYDEKRDKFLVGLGLKVIHIPDKDVKKKISDVIMLLEKEILGGDFF